MKMVYEVGYISEKRFTVCERTTKLSEVEGIMERLSARYGEAVCARGMLK